MRNVYALIFGLLTMVVITSCDNRPDVVGVWTGTPQRVTVDESMVSNSLVTLEFKAPQSKDESGEVTLTSAIEIEMPVKPQGAIIAPYDVNVAATATVNGLWSYVDDDEIAILIDWNTLDVVVDPEAVVFDQDILSEQQLSRIESMRPDLARSLVGPIRQVAPNIFDKYSKISDIKIAKGLVTCEIGDRDYTFHLAQPK